MGVKSVSLLDDSPVEMADLGSQVFLTGMDLGKPRAACSVKKLAALNREVNVSVGSGALDAALISKHQVVVLATGEALSRAVVVNTMCREAKVKFLWADVKGCFSFVFTDFGPAFQVLDLNGEPPETYMISHITQDKEGGVVSIIEDQILHLQDGDTVVFTGVDGMTELNYDKEHNPEPYVVTVTGVYSTLIL